MIEMSLQPKFEKKSLCKQFSPFQNRRHINPQQCQRVRSECGRNTKFCKNQHFARIVRKRNFPVQITKKLRCIIIIMQKQQSYQIGVAEATQLPLPLTHSHYDLNNYRKQGYCTQEDDKWIQDLLSPSALITQSPITIKCQQAVNDPEIIETPSECKQNHIDQTITPKRQRSLFHNFQKHLITLLKKIAIIRRSDVFNERAGVRAFDLWKIFKESRDFSKKSLYLVFGVTNGSNDSFIAKLAQEQPELQKMLKKYGYQEVECAQALLRGLVIEKVSKLQKQTVQTQCKMAKFEEFYSYFLHFIEQLKGEGLCKRLKKQQKLKVFERTTDISN